MPLDRDRDFVSFMAWVDTHGLRLYREEEYKNAFYAFCDEMLDQEKRIIQLEKQDRLRYPDRGLQRSYGVCHDGMVMNVHVFYSNEQDAVLPVLRQ